ncbi:MAG: hypothetical protein KBG22_10805 [Smithella sp.]|jgi:hypothetical protein|nr:hypothetical protein [Smithella sp.]
MNLKEALYERVRAKLDEIEQAGAKEIRTPARWARLELLADMKVELGGKDNALVDAAYVEFKNELPKQGIRHITVGHDDIFERI